MRKWSPLFGLTLLVLTLSAYAPSGASDENRVAVVVDFGNGQVAKRCVGFAEETITGYEALTRTGLPVETDFQAGGAAVCRIDTQGCPADDCFCACRGGGDCVYWSYWHQLDGNWSYSAAGSSSYQVRDGAVEGWVWGFGSVTQASPPPPVTFGEVCAAEATATPTQTATPSRTATPVVLPTLPPAGGEALPTMPPTTTPAVAQSPQPSATVPGSTMPAAANAPAPTGSAVGAADTTPTLSPATAGPSPSDEGDDATPVFPLPANSPEAMPGDGTPTAEPSPAETGPTIVPLIDLEDPRPAEPDADRLAIAPNQEPTTVSTAAAVAVVGAGYAAGPSATTALPAPVAGDERLPAYAGFAGLLLLLAALALAVRRRRGATRLQEGG